MSHSRIADPITFRFPWVGRFTHSVWKQREKLRKKGITDRYTNMTRGIPSDIIDLPAIWPDKDRTRWMRRKRRSLAEVSRNDRTSIRPPQIVLVPVLSFHALRLRIPISSLLSLFIHWLHDAIIGSASIIKSNLRVGLQSFPPFQGRC